jgi:hypothetical protein
MKREKKLKIQADSLSAAMPKGTRVRYWPGSKRDAASLGFIDGPFQVEHGLTVVANIKPLGEHGPFGKTVFAVASSHIERVA